MPPVAAAPGTSDTEVPLGMTSSDTVKEVVLKSYPEEPSEVFLEVPPELHLNAPPVVPIEAPVETPPEVTLPSNGNEVSQVPSLRKKVPPAPPVRKDSLPDVYHLHQESNEDHKLTEAKSESSIELIEPEPVKNGPGQEESLKSQLMENGFANPDLLRKVETKNGHNWTDVNENYKEDSEGLGN